LAGGGRGQIQAHREGRRQADGTTGRRLVGRKAEQTLVVAGPQAGRRREDSSFRDYELFLQGGQRDQAADALRACLQAAEQKGEYRRLLAALEERLLTGGRVELEVDSRRLVLIGRFPVLIGRDLDCDLQARGAAVSRHHARLELGAGQVLVSDCDSRNGTLLDGLRIGAPLPLPASGTLALGEDCRIEFTVAERPALTLRLEVSRGLDRGTLALVSLAPLRLVEWLPGAPDVEVSFSNGRPMACARTHQLSLNGALAGGAVQLVRDDTLSAGGRSLRVVG
jgi:hypothetical protein